MPGNCQGEGTAPETVPEALGAPPDLGAHSGGGPDSTCAAPTMPMLRGAGDIARPCAPMPPAADDRRGPPAAAAPEAPEGRGPMVQCPGVGQQQQQQQQQQGQHQQQAEPRVLPPDVLHEVLARSSWRDAASLKLASRRWRAAVLHAGAHWRPAVVERIACSAALAALLTADSSRIDWLQALYCLQQADRGPWAPDPRRLSRIAVPDGFLLVLELLLERRDASLASEPQPALAACCSVTAAAAVALDAIKGQQGAAQAHPACRRLSASNGCDGDVNGSGCSVVSFGLAGQHVDIRVDGHGRLYSPEQAYSLGPVALRPGEPRMLCLEVSYLMGKPFWALHPVLLPPGAPLALDTAVGFGSCIDTPDRGGGTARSADGEGAGQLEWLWVLGQAEWLPGPFAMPPPLSPRGLPSSLGAKGAAGTPPVTKGGAGAPAAAPAPVPHALIVSRVSAWRSLGPDPARRFDQGSLLFEAEDEAAEQLLSSCGLLGWSGAPASI